MRNLSCTIVFLFLALLVSAQSPHGSELKKDCSLCHGSKSWVVNRENVQFSHDSTKFPLIGQHQFVNCRNCHTSLVFTDANTECAGCHSDVHNNTVGQECLRCHTPNSWLIDEVTEMHQQSRFPLMGGHKNVACNSCHTASSNLQFEPVGIECVDCHRSDFQNTTAPNHLAGGFSTLCLECHQPDAKTWQAASIDHDFFPLTGGHNIGCIECHTTGIMDKVPANCIDCHQENFTNAQTPNHIDAGIQNTCDDCHTPASWKPSSFNHTSTGFELTGGHRLIEQCSDCHKGSLVNNSQECISCHQVQYDYAPQHKQFGYPLPCTMCHTTNDWLETSFNHSQTNFPLTGQHVGVDCNSCHTNGFAGTSTSCNSCHISDYQLAQLPSHVAAGLPINCSDCHTTSGWKPSGFNHSTTGFVLSGGHSAIEQCSQCHQGTVSNASRECISCHQSDYNGTTNPNHAAANFPTNCVSCHSVNGWTPATFNHDSQYFPIYSGEHRGEWNTCADCHTNSSNYAIFSCINCHEHNKTEMDQEHRGENGYTYASSACFSCHPRGRAD